MSLSIADWSHKRNGKDKAILNALRKLPFAPVVGVMFGLVAAVLVIATPQFLFERMIVASGLPDLISAATPPLGEKARVMTALLAAGIIGALIYAILSSVDKATARRKPLGRGSAIETARPYAAERGLTVPPRPIFAGSDLGAPFMSDEAMAVAREELLLYPAMIEAEPVATAPGTTVATGQPDRPQTVAGLMSHLEDALQRRWQHTGPAAPAPGDMASLRAALGMSIAA